MPYQTCNMHGPWRQFYGTSWTRDGCDIHAENLLGGLYRGVPRQAGRLRVALEIGGGDMYRASHMARLGLFDRIIAIDIGDRKEHVELAYKYAASATLGPPPPIEFWKKSVLDLSPDDFKNMEVCFVNFRNVAHFLSPPDFRRALDIIRGIAAPGALIVTSFDDADYKDARSRRVFSIREETASRFNRFWFLRRLAPYGRYSRREVAGYMKEDARFPVVMGLPGDCADIRKNEAHILAFAPPAP